jgi:addiction module RelB/DinJ family antitoxin
MANTSAVYARIDTGLKESAEGILSQLGISPSSAIQMLYSQIVLQKGMPFELRLPREKPLAIGDMSRTKLDEELKKGMESLENDKTYSIDEVDEELHREFGI